MDLVRRIALVSGVIVSVFANITPARGAVQALGSSNLRFTNQALAENARGDAVAVWSEDPASDTDATHNRIYVALAAAGHPFGRAVPFAGTFGDVTQVTAAIDADGQVLVAVVAGPRTTDIGVEAARGSVSAGVSALATVVAPDGAGAGLLSVVGPTEAVLGWGDAVIRAGWRGAWSTPVSPLEVPGAGLSDLLLSTSGQLTLLWSEATMVGTSVFDQPLGKPARLVPAASDVGGADSPPVTASLGPVVYAQDGSMAGLWTASDPGQLGGGDLIGFSTRTLGGSLHTRRLAGPGASGDCDAVAAAPDGRAVLAYALRTGLDENHFLGFGSLIATSAPAAPVRLDSAAFTCPVAAAIADHGPGVVLSGGLGATEVGPIVTRIDNGHAHVVLARRGGLDRGEVTVDGGGRPTVLWSENDSARLFAWR